MYTHVDIICMCVPVDGTHMCMVVDGNGHVRSGILCLIACSSEAAGGGDAATAEGGPAAPR